MSKIKSIGMLFCLMAVPSAFSQDYSATFYGRANITAEHQTLGQYSVDGLFNNNSRIGVEILANDLGDDLSLGIILEAGFNIDTGKGQGSDGQIFFNRQSEVNISGSWGMIRAGMFYSESYYATADYISMHNHDTGSSADALYAYVMRDRDKIAYRTPTYNGFKAEVAYAFPEEPEPNSNADAEKPAYEIAMNYELESWDFGLGYSNNDGDYEVGFRAFYHNINWRFGAYLQNVEIEGEVFQTYRLAIMNMIGKNSLHLDIGYADRDHGLGAMQWTVGVNHHFNELTKVYLLYTYLDNERNAEYNYGVNDSLEDLYVNQPGKDFSAAIFGLRRNF